MTAFILEWIARGGYAGIAALMLLENVFPPIPSEVIMGLGGMAVAQGRMAFVPLVLWGTVGSTLGNLFWYAVGRWIGYERLRPVVTRHGRWLAMDWRDVERLHRFFVRHGGWVVFVLRFMPAFRTIVSLPAGMTRMPALRFTVWTFAGSTIWNAGLGWAGVMLGSRFHLVDRYVGPATIALIVVILLAYLYRVVTWRPRP